MSRGQASSPRASQADHLGRFRIVSNKIRIDEKKNLGYVYVLDNVVTAMGRSGLVVHGVLNPFSIAKTYNTLDRGRPKTVAVNSVLL
jgi:hypothetical protein